MNFVKLLVLFFCVAPIISFAQAAKQFEVVITEIMADPTPQVGLPNAEFLEVKNVSSTPFNLNGWRLGDATATATINTSFLLMPDSMVILCSNSNVTAFSAFGRSIGVVSFPSLDNDGEALVLSSPQNKIIHAVNYTTQWYGNEAKKDGGWTLEMIDTKNPCAGANNWKASVAVVGGTPGKTNSVNAVNIDNTPPQLKRTITTDSVTAILFFDEGLDSATASLAGNYSVNGNTVLTAMPLPPFYNSVQIKIATPLAPSIVYTIAVKNVGDCKGNTMAGSSQAQLGLAQALAVHDVVINEILFNPKPNGADYIELYNNSKKIIDLSKLYLANRNSNGVVSSLSRISTEPFFLFPSSYLVVTEDPLNLSLSYLVKDDGAVMTISSLASYPDDKGTVVLVDVNNVIADEVAYNDDWHFALIADKEGVALERLDFNAASQNKNNWHSAASTAGYGTPGYKNSQTINTTNATSTIEIATKIFSPDNDGIDDVASICYNIAESGYIANIIIFDINGRRTKHLVKNAVLGLSGCWNWDGLDEKNQKLPIGNYVVYAELFNLKGTKEQFKKTISLARRL